MTTTGPSSDDDNADPGPGADAEDVTKAKRRRGRRAARLTAHGIGLIVAQVTTLVVILIFAFLIRLQGGPIDLGVFAPTIEAAVNRNLDGSIEIGGVMLSTDRASDEPRLQLQEVKLRDPEGRLVLSAPRFSARFDTGAMLSGRFAPTDLTLIGATAILTRGADGSFEFGISGASPESAETINAEESPLDAFSTFAAGLAFPEKRRDPFTALDSIAVRNAFLIYRDEIAGRVWRAPGSFLRVWAGEEGARAFARISLAGSGAERTDLTMTGRRLRDSDQVQVRASFQNLLATDLADLMPAFYALGAADGTLDGGVDVELAPDGRMTALNAHLRADSVVAEMDGDEHLLDFADASFSLDVASDTLRIESLEASALGVTGALNGEVALRRNQDSALVGAEISLSDLSLSIARPDLFVAPVAVSEGRLSGSVSLGETRSFEVSEFTFSASAAGIENAKLSASGELALTPLGTLVELNAQAEPITIQQAVGLWPKGVGRNGRGWVEKNVTQGRVSNARASVAIAPGEDPVARLDFDFADAVSTYLKDMPPLVDASGAASLRDGVYRMDFDAVTVKTEDGDLDLSGSTLEIIDLFDAVVTSRPTIRAVGPSAAALNVIDHEPLALPSKIGLVAASVSGDVMAEGVLEFPLLATLKKDQIQLDFNARLTQLSMTVPNSDLKVEAEEVSLAADEAGMDVEGAALVGGHPARISWRENFVVSEGARRRLDFQTTYTAADAVEAGVPAVLFRDGVAAVDGRIEFSDGTEPSFSARADLNKALLEAPNIGWRKEAGTPGELNVSGGLGEKVSLAVDLQAPGLEGRGSVVLADGGAAIDIGRLAIAGIGEFSGDVKANSKRIDVVLQSPSVDLELFLNEGAADTSGLNTPELSITLNADGAHLTGALWAGALSGNITITEGQKRATFNGLINGDAPFTGEFTGTTEESRLLIRSDEAGRSLRALGALQSGRGGTLRLDMRLSGAEAPIEGEVHIEDLVVTEAPVLAEMLSVASLVGAVDKLASGGVTFSTIEADFRAEDSLIYVSDAAAFGPTVGLTAQGSFDLEKEVFDLSGSISPAYVINGLINAVPLLGEALTGGEGEGIFGIAYELKGPATAPEISVNPISAFAIGPFRRLFSDSADNGEEDDEGSETDAGKTARDRLRERREARD